MREGAIAERKKHDSEHRKYCIVSAPSSPLRVNGDLESSRLCPGSNLRAFLITPLKASEGPRLLGPTQAEGRQPTNGTLLLGQRAHKETE